MTSQECKNYSKGLNASARALQRTWPIYPTSAVTRSPKRPRNTLIVPKNTAAKSAITAQVVPAKRARFNRARASRDPVINGRRECANRFGYWIPALARRAKPGSLGRNDRHECCGITSLHSVSLPRIPFGLFGPHAPYLPRSPHERSDMRGGPRPLAAGLRYTLPCLARHLGPGPRM